MRAFIKGLGALALLTALLFGFVELIALAARHFGRQMFQGVNPTVSAAAVAAMSTITVAVATLVLGRYFERRAAIDAEIRASKIPVYSRLTQGLLQNLLRGGANTDESDELIEMLREITPQLIAWASDEVIISWAQFKRSITVATTDAERESALFDLEKMLTAIRRDYGHKGRTVKEGDLISLFISDADELLARRRSSG